MITTGLQIVGKFQGSTIRDYTDKDGNEKKAYTLWILLEGNKINISTNLDPDKDLNLESNKYYNFPVGTRAFEFTDKQSGQIKLATSFFLRKDSVVTEIT